MNQSRGFSVTEIVISLGLMAGIGLMATKLVTDSKKVEKTRSILGDMEDMKILIRQGLKSKESCMLNLNNKNATSDGLSMLRTIRKGSVVKLLEKDKPFGSMGLVIESLRLEDKAGMEDGVDVVPNDMGSTNLVITMKKPAAMNSPGLIGTKIKLAVKTNSSGQIQDCFSFSSGEDMVWAQSDVDPNDIYYTGGNVGVGTENPQDMLHVAGSIISRNTNGDRIALGGGPADYRITLSADKVFEFWDGMTGRAADLEAGTIVADYVTLGTSTNSCTAANSGAIIFDSGTGKVSICEGGVWKDKRIVTWCTPPAEIKAAHDEWIRFHQVSGFRPKGYRCDNSQVRKKGHKYIKIKTDTSKPYTFIRFDDAKKDKDCSSNSNCRDYNPEHQ